MKSMPVTEHERQFLVTIASEYEERGYTVKLQPPADDMPEFLASFEPDLIATGNGESVVVEVKGRRELRNVRPIAALEAAVRDRPGWRFELIIDGSDAEHRSSLSALQIATSLEEANELQRNGHMVAALLLSWSATEGILRLLAVRDNVDLKSPSTGYIITQLYTLGLIGGEQYRILNEAVRLRNQAAHGFQVSVTRQDLASLVSVARELLTELESKAA